MKNNKIKLSVLITLVLCMVVSFAMPIMTSATETTEQERVISDLQNIRDYADGVVKPGNVPPSKVATKAKTDFDTVNQDIFGKGLVEGLDILIKNYKADPSDRNLQDIALFLETWMWGGHDAEVIFLTDKLFGYFYDFSKLIEEKDLRKAAKADELAFVWPMSLKDKDKPDSGYLYTFAKRFITNTDTYKDFYANSKVGDDKGINGLFEHFLILDPDLYVAGRDANTQIIKDKIEETKAAMNTAATAKDAYEYLKAFMEFINTDGHMLLKSASESYRLIAELDYIANNINDGDAELLEGIKEYKEVLSEELETKDTYGFREYPNSGIVQYRPSAQATSFTEDSKFYSEKFDRINEEVQAAIEEYAATVSDFDARIAGFTYDDPYPPINNGGNSGNNNGGSSNKPDNTADALTAFLAVTAIVSAGCVVALVRAKRIYNR